MNYEDSKRIMLEQREEGKRRVAIAGEAIATPPVDNSNDPPGRRNPIRPGRFWARSTAGVYMNGHRRRMNGY
jgi:hypothetical protein